MIEIRQQYKSFRSFNMKSLRSDATGAVTAFHRWQDDENFIVVVNLADNEQPVNIYMDKFRLKNLSCKDILTGETFEISQDTLPVRMQPFSTRLIMVAGSH